MGSEQRARGRITRTAQKAIAISAKMQNAKNARSGNGVRMLGFDLAWWNTAMLVSLGLAAFAAVAVLITTRAVIVLQDRDAVEKTDAFEKYKLQEGERTAALENKTRSAEAKIADATARAAEAQLALEQFKADRTLSDWQKFNVVESISKFAGQKYVLSVSPDPESSRFVLIVDRLLSDAKWVRVPTSATIKVPNIDAALAVSPEPGVRVQMDPSKNGDSQFMDRALTLVRVLNTNGIFAAAAFNSDELREMPDVLQIRVASKH